MSSKNPPPAAAYFNTVFARSVIRARICKRFARQLLCTQTPRGCGRDAQLAPSLFKLLKTSSSHQGPFWPLRPGAHRYLRSAGLLGEPMLENLGFNQLRFVSAAGPWLRFSGHSRCRGSCQDQADDADAGSKPWLKVSRTTTCTQRLAPAPTLARPHLLLRQPGTRAFFSSSIVQLTGLFHPQLGVRAQRSPCHRGGLLRPAGQYTPKHKLSLFSLLLCFPCPTKGLELTRWGRGGGNRLRKDPMRCQRF